MQLSSCPTLDPRHLSGLSSMKWLRLTSMRLGDFNVPSSWGKLELLDLVGNRLLRLPGNLSVLTSLQDLNVSKQRTDADFQLEEGSLSFVTQLRNLRRVQLHRIDGRPWNSVSIFVLMQAQMLINNTPGCQVSLLD
ncbi:hypothetical protein WJX73_000808 [Symbiochloris irregularis]|uniref:Uncharacterized protein n=1 Tax=Symbiochloris irregularis TaxID=706552 RepID=A0AAW1P3Z8_9CHLO